MGNMKNERIEKKIHNRTTNTIYLSGIQNLLTALNNTTEGIIVKINKIRSFVTELYKKYLNIAVEEY